VEDVIVVETAHQAVTESTIDKISSCGKRDEAMDWE
jgi:hypothetical protein